MTLAVNNLTCGYRYRSVLSDVTLKMTPGNLLVILGPNGAGKTTLLRALARLIRPQGGQVLLEGKDIWTYHPAEVARAVTYNPQVQSADWPFRVREFVALGRAPHCGWWRPLRLLDQQIIEACLEDLCLTPFQDRLVTELSGGEWQRVRLAKALVQQPRYLLLDEPTSHLDLRFQLELLSTISRLVRTRNLSVIMSLHDLNLVGPWAHQVALLNQGRLIQVGDPDTVLTTSSLQSAYGIPLAVAHHPVTKAIMISMLPEPSGSAPNGNSSEPFAS